MTSRPFGGRASTALTLAVLGFVRGVANAMVPHTGTRQSRRRGLAGLNAQKRRSATTNGGLSFPTSRSSAAAAATRTRVAGPEEGPTSVGITVAPAPPSTTTGRARPPARWNQMRQNYKRGGRGGSCARGGRCFVMQRGTHNFPATPSTTPPRVMSSPAALSQLGETDGAITAPLDAEYVPALPGTASEPDLEALRRACAGDGFSRDVGGSRTAVAPRSRVTFSEDSDDDVGKAVFHRKRGAMAFRGGSHVRSSSWSGGCQDQSGEQPAASSTVEVPYTYSRADDATTPHPVTDAYTYTAVADPLHEDPSPENDWELVGPFQLPTAAVDSYDFRGSLPPHLWPSADDLSLPQPYHAGLRDLM